MIKSMILLFFIILSSVIHAQIYLDPEQSVNNRVDDLLKRMTLEEKIGQMTQVGRAFLQDNTHITQYFIGSILSGGGSSPPDSSLNGWIDMYDTYQSYALRTRLKIPLMYGIDAVHGHNNVKGAVIFPHNIGMGCTGDIALVEEAARITALEVAATGIDWTFAPCIAVARDERWGRTYESFSEDPEIVSLMGAAMVKGFQSSDLKNTTSILACAKHFLGDGGTIQGKDQGNTVDIEQTLRTLHLTGYSTAVKNGVGSVMASFNSWKGQKIHGNSYLLTEVLKNELGFEGFIVSDWAAIDQLPGDYRSDIKTSIKAGIDMVMVPDKYLTFINLLKELVENQKIPESRIDDAVKRILTIKFKLGLFEHPYTDRSLMDTVGCDYHRTVARECVRKSLVLLNNKKGLLPLPKSDISIQIAGKNADNLGSQCGGWTISWQGSSGEITTGTTILEGLKMGAPEADIFYSLTGEEHQNVDIGIAVIGEEPYAEMEGDWDSLVLRREDIQTVKNLKKSGKSVITILITGRPLIINSILPYSDALICVWLPGTEGEGVADVIFGDYPPTGKLSFTWPQSMEQIPINIGDRIYKPLFPYGYGITEY